MALFRELAEKNRLEYFAALLPHIYMSTEIELRAATVQASERLRDPYLVDTICGALAAGNTLVSLASAWSVSYADLVTLLQRDAKVWERVQRSMEARKEWAAEAILRELRDLAMSDLRQAFDESGALKPPDQWPDSLARAISSIEIDEFYEGRGDERTQVGWTKKIKLWDKPAALKQLREHLAAGLGAAATGGEMSLESMIEASISGYERARDKILRERAAAGRASESVDIEAEAVSVESDEPL